MKIELSIQKPEAVIMASEKCKGMMARQRKAAKSNER